VLPEAVADAKGVDDVREAARAEAEGDRPCCVRPVGREEPHSAGGGHREARRGGARPEVARGGCQCCCCAVFISYCYTARPREPFSDFSSGLR
jgi:hypothetical protein